MNNQDTQNNAIVEISLDNLRIHPKNVRESYEGIEELAASIKKNGILQNLTVVPDPENEDMYLVVIGNRRLTAAKEAGIASAPCRIADMEEAEQVMSMLTENMNRKNLKIHEEIAGIQMCLSDFGFSVEDVAQKTGLSQTTVRHRANMAKLDRKALREKAEDGSFQLSITDLAKLEKVTDIATRNKILREARDSRDLAWKAQSAADEEKKKKATKKLTALAKKEKIEPAPEEAAKELYGNKWETVAEYDLTGEIPKKLVDGETGGLFYVIHYRMFKILRKAKKVKRELTDDQVKERGIAKKRRQISAMYKEMHAQIGDFIRSIIDGKTEEWKNVSEIASELWEVLVIKSAWISRNSMLSVLLGKETYEASEEERKEAQEKLNSLPLHHQMLLIAHHCCKDVELAGHNGFYAENNARPLKKLYSCLALYGFSFAAEEYTSLMEGSHPLYAVMEEMPGEDSADDGTDFVDGSLTSDGYPTQEESDGQMDTSLEEEQKRYVSAQHPDKDFQLRRLQ